MSVPADDSAAPVLDRQSRLGRLFVLIVLVEAVTVSALYWFGVHFS